MNESQCGLWPCVGNLCLDIVNFCTFGDDAVGLYLISNPIKLKFEFLIEPTNPGVFFGYFDILLFLIVIGFNVLIWKTDLMKNAGCLTTLLVAVVLLLVFPYMSARVEATYVYRKHTVVDNFNLWYIWFRIIGWWVIGLFEMLVFGKLYRAKYDN